MKTIHLPPSPPRAASRLGKCQKLAEVIQHQIPKNMQKAMGTNLI